MKFSVASISLPNHVIEESADEVKAAGFEGIEWRVAPRSNSIPDKIPAHPFLVNNAATLELSLSEAQRACRATKAAGLELVGLGPYVEVGDEPTLRLVLEMARVAGAGQIRIQAPRIYRTNKSYGALFAETQEFYELVEREALAAGVAALIEIHHNTICSSASLAYRLVSNFNPSAIGVIYDVGNMVYEGYEDHRIGLEILGPYLRHVHIKNAVYERVKKGEWRPAWSPLDDGIVDVPAFIETLVDFGYDRWVSVEDLSLNREPLATLRHNAACLREWGLMPGVVPLTEVV